MEISGGSLMAEQLTSQLGDGGSNPTSPLQIAWQYQIRLKKSKEQVLSLFSLIPEDKALKNALVKRIDFMTAKTIIEEYEWLGVMPLPRSCRFMYGIYFDDILGGAVVYVHPTTQQFYTLHPRGAVYLNRGACAWWTPPNTASRLIAVSLKMLKAEGIKIIVAYCTPEAGEIGTIYQALGWWYVGETSGDTMYYLDNKWTGSRMLSDKKKWARARGQRWVDKFNNLPKKKVLPKYKYVKILGSSEEIQGIAGLYNFCPLPYPKREIVGQVVQPAPG